MYEKAKELLPKEILESKDIGLLRDIRAVADDLVQKVKQENIEKDIDSIRPKYEGKYILLLGKMYDGPVSIPNPNDLHIIKVHKINFVGHDFFRCKVSVCHITYGGKRDKSCIGFDISKYEEVCIDTYEDEQYSINFNKQITFLTEKKAVRYIEDAKKVQANAIKFFYKSAGIKEKTNA